MDDRKRRAVASTVVFLVTAAIGAVPSLWLGLPFGAIVCIVVLAVVGAAVTYWLISEGSNSSTSTAKHSAPSTRRPPVQDVLENFPGGSLSTPKQPATGGRSSSSPPFRTRATEKRAEPVTRDPPGVGRASVPPLPHIDYTPAVIQPAVPKPIDRTRAGYRWLAYTVGWLTAVIVVVWLVVPLFGGLFAKEPAAFDEVTTSTNGVNFVTFSPDGKTLATTRDGQITFWDVASRQQSGQPLSYAGPLALGLVRVYEYSDALSYSPDGKYLATLAQTPEDKSETFRVQIWSATSRQQLSAIPNARSTASFSADSKTAAYIEDETADTPIRVRLWDVTGKKYVGAPLTNMTRTACCVAFSPTDKSLLAVGGESFALWNTATRKKLNEVRLSSEQLFRRVTTMAFSRDGSTLAIGVTDGTALIWDIRKGRQLGTLTVGVRNEGETPPGLEVSGLALSPDGKLLAAAAGQPPSYSDRGYFTRIWDVTAKAPIGPSLSGTKGGSVAFSPDGTLVATADTYSLRLWHVDRLMQSSRP